MRPEVEGVFLEALMRASRNTPASERVSGRIEFS